MRKSTGVTAGIVALGLIVTSLAASVSSPTSYDKTQDARIGALESQAALAKPRPTPTPTATLTPTPSPSPTIVPTPSPSSSQVVRLATPSTALATLQAWAADSTVDVIDFQCCTYPHFGTLYLKQTRTRPLLWKSEPGVVFDGTGVSGTGAIHVATLDGPGTPAAAVGGMTFNFAGAVFQNYNLGSFGLFMTGWVNGIVFDHETVRNITGDPNLSHVFYIESDRVHRGTDVTISNADVQGPNRALGSGVQVYAHDTSTGTYNVHVIGGTWSGLSRWCLCYSDGIGFLADGVTISNVGTPIEAPALPPLNQIQGTVRNVHATGSGPNRWSSPLLTDGGGNFWN